MAMAQSGPTIVQIRVFVTSAFCVWDPSNLVSDPLFQTTLGLRTHCYSHYPFKYVFMDPLIVAWDLFHFGLVGPMDP